MKTERLVGYEVYAKSKDACVREIVDCIISRQRNKWMACLNPHSYVVARARPKFAQALQRASWLVPDGVGIVLASILTRGTIRSRITGSDVFYGVNEQVNQRGGCAIFLFGSTAEHLAEIKDKLQGQWKNLRVVGEFAPPFQECFSTEDLTEFAEAINNAKPDVVWVGLSAPKQEELIERILPLLDVRFVGAIGAVFDFYTGRIKRSHPVVQRVGLEWLPRLIQEPRRLWRRTFISAPVFVSYVIGSAWKESWGRLRRWLDRASGCGSRR